MAEQRQIGFSAGRYCAQKAQIALGLTPQAIGRNQRAPVWPKSLRGSITHSDQYAAAVVSTYLNGVGIDLELRNRVDEKLHRMALY